MSQIFASYGDIIRVNKTADREKFTSLFDVTAVHGTGRNSATRLWIYRVGSICVISEQASCLCLNWMATDLLCLVVCGYIRAFQDYVVPVLLRAGDKMQR